MQKTALITGSETFGRYIINPTKWLALAAEGKVINNHRIYSLVFPSIIRLPEDAENHGETIVKKAKEIEADVVLSFGMASEVKGFRIERSGTNWIENKKYCPAYEQRRPVDPARPAHEQVQIDLNLWNLNYISKSFQKQAIPYDHNISDDAGKYSCNGWIYRTTQAMKRHRLHIPYLFVHIACTAEAIEFIPDFPRDKKTIIEKEDLLKALEIFLGAYKN